MGNLHLYLIFFAAIFIIELLMSIVMLQLERFFEWGYYYDVALKDALLLTFGRLKYHYPIAIILFIILMKNISYDNRVIVIALINACLYFFILLFYAIFINPDIREYFLKPAFYFNLIAVFLSPFVLGKIPYFKKLMKELI